MTEPPISIRGLTKSYGPEAVLKGVDLDVASGHVLGYLGPNGAGKSTTVKILMGMLDEFGGEVRICGHDVRRGRRHRVAPAGFCVMIDVHADSGGRS